MKRKLTIIVLLILMTVTGCDFTYSYENTAMLQKKYEVVYLINTNQYITIDSVGSIFDVRVNKGEIVNIVEIK